MAQLFKVPAALPEDLESVPRTHSTPQRFTSICNSRVSSTLFWPPQTPGTHLIHRHAGKTQVIIIFPLKRERRHHALTKFRFKQRPEGTNN